MESYSVGLLCELEDFQEEKTVFFKPPKLKELTFS